MINILLETLLLLLLLLMLTSVLLLVLLLLLSDLRISTSSLFLLRLGLELLGPLSLLFSLFVLLLVLLVTILPLTMTGIGVGFVGSTKSAATVINTSVFSSVGAVFFIFI